MATSKKINRREFLGSAAAASLAFTIVPRQVLGGPGYMAPSDKITLGYIGCGTQGLREMTGLISNPALQIVAVCDPNNFTTDYVDWSQNDVRNSIRQALGDKSWGEGIPHKPIANRIYEAKLTIETAKKTGLSTHLLAWRKKPDNEVIKKWISEGQIGKLKEIHNWSNRPMWPQWQTNPTDTPPVPKDFNWDLWLGPVPDRPYHPNYTHAVFRGWYDFGAGSIADMGHYSLFPLFLALGINTPAISAEAYGTTTCALKNNVAYGVRNDVAFPLSCIIRFKFPAQKELGPFDLFWYDGGMKPVTPDELSAEGKSLTGEGMMFVGDKGKIIAQFGGESPVLYPENKPAVVNKSAPESERQDSNSVWIDAFKNNTQSPGSFIYAGPVTETILLGGVALRARRRVEYDSENMKITNVPDANKFLVREYRKGWEL
ncbi:MAG: gfo/Idh/MocA family oxidoreductase [Bacteroidia bacterium]|nr:gfo/Idh/MocA family oxidoreductase [Bacteroidia bacterium]